MFGSHKFLISGKILTWLPNLLILNRLRFQEVTLGFLVTPLMEVAYGGGDQVKKSFNKKKKKKKKKKKIQSRNSMNQSTRSPVLLGRTLIKSSGSTFNKIPLTQKFDIAGVLRYFKNEQDYFRISTTYTPYQTNKRRWKANL